MRCFAHKKSRHKKASLAEQDASAKMMRTMSAPPTFLVSTDHDPAAPIPPAPPPLAQWHHPSPSPPSPSPNTTTTTIRNPRSKPTIAVPKIAATARMEDGSSSPLVTHSGPSGFASLSGVKRDPILFRGQPLPLPTPESCGLSPDSSTFMASPAVSSRDSTTASAASDHHRPGKEFKKSASMPLPRPPPPAHERLAAAHITFCPETSCIGESGNGPAFTCTVSIDANPRGEASSKDSSMQAVLIRLSDTTMQDSKAWIEHVKEIVCLRDAHLSRILGFSFTTDEKLVVYEIQANGSLDRLLYGRSRDRPPLDWATRVRIATDAARGLAFLHERSPRKLMYKDFRTFNVHVDKELRARLMGYGFTQRFINPSSIMVAAYAAPELLHRGAPSPPSPKSNVWSFGVVMLEILTGRQNRDEMFATEEQDLVGWTAPYLANDKKLFLVVDPELKGMFPARSVSLFAKLAAQCLQRDPAARPSMDHVVQSLELVQAERDHHIKSFDASTSSGGSDSRKPLIEALRECSSPAAAVAIHPAFSTVNGTHVQRKLVTRIIKTLCSTPGTFD